MKSLTLREGVARTRRLPRNDEVIAQRSELLARRDRDLIDAVIIRGQSVEAVARMMGRSPRTVRKHILLLCHRMTSQKFLDVARALPYLQTADARIASAAFCQCLSQPLLCRMHGLKRHALRRWLDKVAARIEMINHLQSKTRLDDNREKLPDSAILAGRAKRQADAV